MPINVSEALDSDTSEILTIERTTGGGYVDGLYSGGSVDTFNTFGSVQQPTPKELQKLPEGERDKDVRKFITKKQLRTTSDRDSEVADSVLYRGENYKIIQSGDWQTYGYCESYGVREQ